MKILFIADGRSPTTRSWISYWANNTNEIHLISTYPCNSISGLTSLKIIPVALSGFSRGGVTTLSRIPLPARTLFRVIRYFLGPPTILKAQTTFAKQLELILPDIVHALRIPFEGMMSYKTPHQTPFVISTWGNDLTLHAKGSILMKWFTQQCLQRADAILSDTARDIQLAELWGLKKNAPRLIMPGAGGIDQEKLLAILQNPTFKYPIPNGNIVVNSRGHRPGSLRQDAFLKAIPLVLKTVPDTFFLCPALDNYERLLGQLRNDSITDHVRILPYLEQPELWHLFSRADVFVSPSIHDGVPNSLLEAMACGCFPVVGDIVSMREWIRDGENGFLIDSTNPLSIAQGIITALKHKTLRVHASEKNKKLIAERASYRKNMEKAKILYEELTM